MITPSELNQLVSLVAYTSSQNDTGTITATNAETIDGVWANIKQLGGDTNTAQGQQISNAQYKIVIRYLPQMTENWLIVYNDITLKITQMQVDNPAYMRYLIIYCSTTIQQTSWS